jgi:hypothetical protein
MAKRGSGKRKRSLNQEAKRQLSSFSRWRPNGPLGGKGAKKKTEGRLK